MTHLIYDEDTLDPPEQPEEYGIEPHPVSDIRSMEQLLEYLGVDTENQ